METKDLILLMLIPIILGSLVFYVDKSPSIIGAVTSEPKIESNRLGIYSINPSFKAKMNYDLNDYAIIKEKLDFIIKCSQEGKDVETCIGEVNKDKSFTWQLGCDKGAEKVLYDFAEFLQDCIDSDDNNCLCRKSMKITKEELQGYLPPTNEYQFTITETVPTRRIDIELPNFDGVSYSVDKKGLSGRIPKIYSLGYDKLEDLLKFNLCFIKNEVLNTPIKDIFGECSETFGPTEQIIIYKNQLKDGTKAINFVNQKDATLVYPNGDVEKDQNGNSANPANIPNCQLKPKNIYKFCVTQNNYKVVAYDKLDGQIKERNPVVKFASYVPQLPPPPLTGIGVLDKQTDEKSVIIKWDKGKNAVKYNIYYAKSNLNVFDEKPLSEIMKKAGFMKKELSLNPVELNGIELTSCTFDLSKKGCVYKTVAPDGVILEKEKLYYVKEHSKEYYFYVLRIEENIDYDFSITAVDKNGNEIDNVKDKLPVFKSKKSTDDLPISSRGIVISRVFYEEGNFLFPYDFRRKHANIDGSQAEDFDSYNVYYYKAANLNLEQIKETQQSLINKPLKELTYLFEFRFNPEKPEAFKSPKIEIKDNEHYFFIVAAADKNRNPSQNLKPVDIDIELPSRYPS